MQDDDSTGWYGSDIATFGDRVAGAREAAGMTRPQLARRLGIKRATLEGWEEDVSEPRANKLSMLSGLLNVSIPWLLTGDGEGPAGPEDGADDSLSDVPGILQELRVLRTELRSRADQVARLEKRIRRLTEAAE